MAFAPKPKAPVGGTRSMLGTQVRGGKVSAPSYGFGSSTRKNQEKVFVSHEHAALEGGGDARSPGPAVYDCTASVGPQVDGNLESAPRWAFGKDDRFGRLKPTTINNPAPGKYDAESSIGTTANSRRTSMPKYGMGSSTRDHQAKVYVSEEHNKTTDYGRNSPGPSTYMLKSAVGSQVLSAGPSPYGAGAGVPGRNASQPSWVMGKAERFDALTKSEAPGPGAYGIKPAVGTQVTSNKASMPKFGFGTSNRDHMSKVFISKEHEKVTGGRDAPGPGTNTIPSLTGKPVVSGHQRSGASWGFGSSKRFTDAFKHQKDNPGPGHYVI